MANYRIHLFIYSFMPRTRHCPRKWSKHKRVTQIADPALGIITRLLKHLKVGSSNPKQPL